jgi:hypothetical protein
MNLCEVSSSNKNKKTKGDVKQMSEDTLKKKEPTPEPEPQKTTTPEPEEEPNEPEEEPNEPEEEPEAQPSPVKEKV